MLLILLFVLPSSSSYETREALQQKLKELTAEIKKQYKQLAESIILKATCEKYEKENWELKTQLEECRKKYELIKANLKPQNDEAVKKDCNVNNGCPAGYELFAGTRHCYKVTLVSNYDDYDNDVTQEDARKICLTDDGDLVSIHSADEQRFVSGLVEKRLGSDSYAYIGLHSTKNHFSVREWTDGTPFDYVGWGPDRPNNLNDSDSCTIIYPNWGWDDWPCNALSGWYTNGAVCKRARFTGC